jgi:hypothetical protein
LGKNRTMYKHCLKVIKLNNINRQGISEILFSFFNIIFEIP